jgi:PAS domain S-box-containing protein/excisionase family DNA binding protein
LTIQREYCGGETIRVAHRRTFHPMHRFPPQPRHGASHGLEDPLQVGAAAAELGTWDWDLLTNDVRWTPQMYLLFGLEAGRFTTTFENVMALIHPEDRPRVDKAVERSLRDLRRSVTEFRIVRPDGSVRWLRCSGRAFADDRGKAIRMAGMAEDISHFKSGGEAAVGSVEHSLSTRQVAQLLGIGEASVKRLANGGAIGFLRSSRKDSRRFAAEQVVEYLRRIAQRGADLNASIAARDVDGCVAALMEEVGRGVSLDELLDRRFVPAVSELPRAFVTELLARVPALVGEARKSAPAFLAIFGEPEGYAAQLVECSLRGHGYSVLTAAEGTGSSQLADLIERVRARVVVLVAASQRPAQRAAAEVAASAAARLRGVVVAMHDEGRGPLPAGVSRVRTLRELGRLVRG